MGNHKNTIQNFPRAHQNHRDNHMACSKVKKVNLKKNDFSRLKKTKTQQILVNKFMRESIVAVSKLNTKYAVMLITASYCLSAVEANDNNQTDQNSQSHYKDNPPLDNVIAIVGSVVGVLGFILAVAALVVKIYFLTKNQGTKKIQCKQGTRNRGKKSKNRGTKKTNEILDQHLKRNKLNLVDVIQILMAKDKNPQLIEYLNKADESQNLIPFMEENGQQNQQELEEEKKELFGKLKKELED